MNSLTVLVPFYNEEKTLYKSVSRLLNLDIFDEIILINDSSNDESLLIAHELEKQNRNVILVSTKQNLGKGGALNYAKNLISSDFVVIHDADLEYDPRDIVNLFNLVSLLSADNAELIFCEAIFKFLKGLFATPRSCSIE